MIAHKEEEIKLQERQRIKSQVPSLKVNVEEECIVKNEDEISSYLEEEEEEENKHESSKGEGKSKVNRKKTRTERNKEKKKMARLREEKQKEQQKELIKNLERYPS